MNALDIIKLMQIDRVGSWSQMCWLYYNGEIDFELQCCSWVQYENWMKRGLQIMVLCSKSIQYENLWNMVPGGRDKVVATVG